MPIMPRRLPEILRPIIQVGAQPVKSPAWATLAPSTIRRDTAIIKARVGGILRQDAWGVGDQDAPGVGGGYIDVIYPGAEIGDQL